MDHNLWEQLKSAFYEGSAWVGRQLADNPLMALIAIGVILVLLWAVKPKFRDY